MSIPESEFAVVSVTGEAYQGDTLYIGEAEPGFIPGGDGDPLGEFSAVTADGGSVSGPFIRQAVSQRLLKSWTGP